MSVHPMRALVAAPWQARLASDLGLWWVLACTAGSALVAAAICAAVIPGSLLAGVLFALPQWLVLRRFIARAVWWLVGSGAGMLVGWGMGMFVGFTVGLDVFRWAPGPARAVAAGVGALAGGAAGGFTLGLCQLPVLTRQAAGGPWWLLASSLGGVAITPMVTAMFFGCKIDLAGAEGVARSGLYGATYGGITGLALTWLLGDRRGRAWRLLTVLGTWLACAVALGGLLSASASWTHAR